MKAKPMTAAERRVKMDQYDKINAIVKRGWERMKWGYKAPIDMMLDLEKTIEGGCNLDLDKLLNFPDFDFYHDLGGIHDHLDRSTYKLTQCFLPRCAR